jgi:hypothetical protein
MGFIMGKFLYLYMPASFEFILFLSLSAFKEKHAKYFRSCFSSK